ncbi:hypothetical protein SAMN05216270_10139 [Glycomyces harbinensis]|uniref:Uncharacterized protein n=1 Tax=Glycomyces harbinensis TaxID=58114 RepID=A0A1G6QRL3_9ACTN|nr:hypothetical protein [Glycomyces harbinensis]SDC94365.1 hypothetical protein SAMN05216270_10139 [Glycomyces harbinensis]
MSGVREPMKPGESKSRRPSAHVCWNTSTSAPQAASVDRRFKTMLRSANTGERKAMSMMMNVASSTNPTTRNRRADWWPA